MNSPRLSLKLLFLFYFGHLWLRSVEAISKVGSNVESCSDITSLLPSSVTRSSNSTLYDQSRRQFASEMASSEISERVLSPDVIVYCSNDDEVLAAIRVANECGYKITIRSGGHQYGGFSSCNSEKEQACMQVDMSSFKSHHYDEVKNELTVGVGLEVKEVHSITIPLHVTIPMGVCTLVKVGGHFQSSAASMLSRAVGLGLDHVSSFRIALANETIITAKRGDDLYWAALGGSPGSWGIVLDYTINPLKDVDFPHVTIMYMAFPYTKDIFSELVKTFLDFLKDAEASRDFAMFVSVAPDEQLKFSGDYTHNVYFRLFWTGADSGPLKEGNANYLKFVQPLVDIRKPFFNFTSSPPLSIAANIFTTDFAQPPNIRYHIHTLSMPEVPDNSLIDTYAAEMDERLKTDSGIAYSSLQFIPFGGVDGTSQYNMNTGMNAYPMRDTLLHIDDWVFFEDENEEVARNRVNNIRHITSDFWKVKGSAENALFTTTSRMPADAYTREEKRRRDLEEYYPSYEWMDRLVDVKRMIDPNDLFHSVLTIPTEFKSDGGNGGYNSSRSKDSSKTSKTTKSGKNTKSTKSTGTKSVKNPKGATKSNTKSSKIDVNISVNTNGKVNDNEALVVTATGNEIMNGHETVNNFMEGNEDGDEDEST